MPSFASSSQSSGVDRKLLKKPDEFVASLQRFFKGLAGHSRTVWIALAVLAAVGVLGAVYANYRSDRIHAAREALFQARQTLERELTAVKKAAAPATEKAAPTKDTEKEGVTDLSSVAYQKFDVDETLPETTRQLKAIIQDFGSTRAGFDARLALGDLYFNHGNPTGAVSWYEEAVRRAPGTMERALSLYALGFAQENEGKHAEAVKTYERVIHTGEEGMRGDVWMAMARSFEAMRDSNQARQMYDKIISELANTEYAKKAEILRAQLQ